MIWPFCKGFFFSKLEYKALAKNVQNNSSERQAEQQKLSSVCINVHTRQSHRFSHTQGMDTDEDLDKNFRNTTPLDVKRQHRRLKETFVHACM